MGAQSAFWIDRRFDREHVAGGSSRYTETLWRHVTEFDGVWGDIAPVAFACAAWRIATPPISSPGFVRWHRRVLSATCARNTWDGSLTAHLTLVAPLPGPLAASRDWGRDRGWQEWPEVFGQFVEPSEQDLAKTPHLRPVLKVDAPLPLDRLPAAPDRLDDALPDTAHRALAVLVAELNDLVAPIVARLDGQAR